MDYPSFSVCTRLFNSMKSQQDDAALKELSQFARHFTSLLLSGWIDSISAVSSDLIRLLTGNGDSELR